ncbi:PIN domain-containing protein [bacterium]|nr:PIN domain-containing protein [candidate division CSSED10-310 bacterium]
MRVLVDTSIWSLALRRAKEDASDISRELESLIADHRVVIIGPIRQELLSGIRSGSQFDNLKKRLAAFPDELIASEDYEEAARIFNICRQKGIQGSNTDFLICAVAKRRQFEIFTIDKDFTLFSEVVAIMLYKMEKIKQARELDPNRDHLLRSGN